MQDSGSTRKWTDLAPHRTLRHYAEFAELHKFVLAYVSTKPGQFMSTDACIRTLREHLQFVGQSGKLNDAEIAVNLGIPRFTASRFILGRRPTNATFKKMMRALADQYDIKDTQQGELFDAGLPRGHDTEVATREQTEEALDELLEALEGMIPASQHSAHLNRAPVDLTPEQYTLLVATVRSAQAFSEVESWDKRTTRIIRSLNEILIELEKLLETASSIVSKRLRGMLKAVATMLKRVADAITPPDDQ